MLGPNRRHTASTQYNLFSNYMRPASLGQPIATLVRSTSALEPGESLARAAKLFRETVFDRLPVVQDDRVIGVVTHHSLALAFANGLTFEESVMSALDPDAPLVGPHITGADALRLMAETRVPELIVVDSENHLIGILAAADLADSGPRYITPPLVGGMATPFGVYLTTGSLRAGASDLAVVTTGMLLFSLLFASTWVSSIAVDFLYAHGLSLKAAVNINNFLPFALFMIGIRSMPLASIHAAEHMVVHAIERGEPLKLEIVRRMPRVHPRCGTNIATGASIFSAIAFTEWSSDQQLRVIVAFMVTLFTWRSVGGLVQFFITTKPPKDKHIMMGIQSGQELLDKYRTTRKRASIPLRIFNSGMLHVIAGSTLVFGFLKLISWLFHIELPIE